MPTTQGYRKRLEAEYMIAEDIDPIKFVHKKIGSTKKSIEKRLKTRKRKKIYLHKCRCESRKPKKPTHSPQEKESDLSNQRPSTSSMERSKKSPRIIRTHSLL